MPCRCRAYILALALSVHACSGSERSVDEHAGASAADEGGRTPRVGRREQERGLVHCGRVLERIEGPESAPTFARLIRECSGMWSRRGCRDALGADTFGRERIAEACRVDYCNELRPRPLFCTAEMASDDEFLAEFARFARRALRRDLRRILDEEGAGEIADLYADLIEAQVGRQ